MSKREATRLTAVPRIRFKGCEGEWEVIRGTDLLEPVVEKGHPELPVLSANQERGMIFRDDGGMKIAHNKANEVGYKVVRPGQFVMHLRSFQGGFAHSVITGITSPAYTILRFRQEDRQCDYFWRYYLTSEKFIKSLEIITYGIRDGRSIDFDEFGELWQLQPHKQEQANIAAMFRALDNEIMSARGKVHKLRQLKQSMLVKMFPQRGRTIPEIRFSGFKDEWIEKKLSELSERVTRKNTELQSDLPLTISAEQGLIDQREIFNNRIAAKNVSNYYLVRRGEFAYNRSTSEGHPWGAVKRLDKYEMGVLSTLYMVFSLNEDSVDSEYLVHYYSTVLWHSDVARCAAEGARNHGLLNVSVEDFFSTHVILPRSVAEQQKIGAFFKNLDSLIAAAEKRVAKLRQVKASLLERMFV